MLNSDVIDLTKLVEEHIGDVERGLRVLDSHLQVGAGAVDLLALDARGSIVLIVVGLTGDTALISRALEVYWWCCRHQQIVRRSFPDAVISPAQPPRLILIVQRFAQSFVQGMADLGCEIRNSMKLLEIGVNGGAAVASWMMVGSFRRAVVEPVRPERSATDQALTALDGVAAVPPWPGAVGRRYSPRRAVDAA